MRSTSEQSRQVLIISHDVIGSRMSGTGIRYWELARVLAAHYAVTLVAPQPIDLPDPASPWLNYGSYTWGSAEAFTPWLHGMDVVVANGMLLRSHPELAQSDYPLVVDLYDPVLLEDLELFRNAPAQQRQEVHAQDLSLLKQQLAIGDFFLCATERQRDLYIGALIATGRVTPALVDNDPLLRGLIDVVPYGLPSTTPVKRQPALRGVLSGIGEDDPLLLWSGGLWDWLDPLTLIRAMPQVVIQVPDARLVFLAGRHPGTSEPAVQPMHIPQTARTLAQDLGLLDRHIFFYEQWVPYDQRADFLLEADVLVYLHHPGLESAYAAVRSRFLDHLWSGRASLVSAGDAAAALVQNHQLGCVAAPGDILAVAEQVCVLLLNPTLREECAQRARSLAAQYTWERAAAPLRNFCQQNEEPRTKNRERRTENEEPRTKNHQQRSGEAEQQTASGGSPTTDIQPRTPDPGQQTGNEAMNDQERNQILDRLNQLWKLQPQPLTSGIPLIGQAKELANSLTRWYVQSVVDQQNTFNAALVQSIQALSANDDRRHDELTRHIHFLHHQVHSVRLELAPLIRRFERDERLIEQNRERIEHVVEHLEQRIAHNQDDIQSNHQAVVETQQMIVHTQQDLANNQQAILETQQTVAQIQQDQKQSQKTILDCQELVDQLRQRIEEDEQRIERNKALLEHIIQHLNDVDEADTALTIKLLHLQQQLKERSEHNGAQTV